MSEKRTRSTADTQAKPFRVLMVTGVYPTEERPHAGTFIKSQVDSLIAAGLDVEVLHPKAGPALKRHLDAALQVFFKAMSGRYTVVHGHYGLWCLIARLQWRTPVVASYLGDDILGTFTEDGGYSRKGEFVAAISRRLCYWVDAVIVKSEQMKKKAGGPQQKIAVIPNGVNFAQFRPVPRHEARATLGWDPEKYYVLFANNPNIPVKHFALAQAAVELLNTKGYTIELVIANGLPHTTVIQYMNASNALILSSRAEGSPNVVKEAMACNVPVVATRVGDVADVIGQTEGCAVCEHTAEDLAAGLERSLAHKGPTTGRQDIQHLDTIHIAHRIIEIYERITGKKIDSRLKAEKNENRRSGDEIYA